MASLKGQIRWPVMVTLTVGMFTFGVYDDGDLLLGVLLAMSPWIGFAFRVLTDDLGVSG